MNEIISSLSEEIINLYLNKLLIIKNNYHIFKKEMENIPESDFQNIDNSSNENNYWNVYLIKTNSKHLDKKKYTPKTLEILKDNMFLNVSFSLLKPGITINPHKDTLSHVFRSHLGISVPEKCKFICDEKDITTNEGEINFFDLTKIHYGFNQSDKNRIVLLVDILKMEFSWLK